MLYVIAEFSHDPDISRHHFCWTFCQPSLWAWYCRCMPLDGGEGNGEGTEVVEAGDEEAIHLRDIAVPTRIGLVEKEELLLLTHLCLSDLDINEGGLLM